MTPKTRLDKLEKQTGRADNLRIIVKFDEVTKQVFTVIEKLPGKNDGGIRVRLVLPDNGRAVA